MTKKWPLFVGIALLLTGIVLRVLTDFEPWSLLILLSGVVFKVAYIIAKTVRREYQPGYEVLFLVVGLALFMGGIVLHKQGLIENPFALKMIGISLKIAFIILFIRKSKK